MFVNEAALDLAETQSVWAHNHSAWARGVTEPVSHPPSKATLAAAKNDGFMVEIREKRR